MRKRTGVVELVESGSEGGAVVAGLLARVVARPFVGCLVRLGVVRNGMVLDGVDPSSHCEIKLGALAVLGLGNFHTQQLIAAKLGGPCVIASSA
jgi:hypothetical protein